MDTETETLVNSNNDFHIEGKTYVIPEEQQRQRFLENEIHKISLKMMEGEMVRKKYDVIHDMLKKEQVHYSRQHQQLDQAFKTQLKEVGKVIA